MPAMVGIGGNGWQYPKIPSQPASDLLPKLASLYIPNSSSKDIPIQKKYVYGVRCNFKYLYR